MLAVLRRIVLRVLTRLRYVLATTRLHGIVLVELHVVEAAVTQAAVVDDEDRAVPVRVVQRDPDGRLELDGWIVRGPADIVGADLAAQRDIGGAIQRAYGTDMRGGHRGRQASLLGAEDQGETADRQREGQHQDGSGQLFGPVLHPPE